MTWTSPQVWDTGDVITAGKMNAISDNLRALKNPPLAQVTKTGTASNYQAVNPSGFVLIAPDFDLTLETTGGDLLIGFSGYHQNHSAWYDVRIDGSQVGDSLHGLTFPVGGSVSLLFLKTGVGAGTHNVELVWRTANDTHPSTLVTIDRVAQFWVREVN